jgi:hypothetical protein
MKLRLRGSADALNRSAQRSTATLEKQRRNAEKPVVDQPVPQAEVDATARAGALGSLEQVKTTVQQAETLTEQDRKRLWANAMTDPAAECSRDLAKLPPAQRRAEIIRIGALNATARELNQENASGPSDLGQHALQN